MTAAPERFVRHALETHASDIPPRALERARVFVLDTLGVGVAGSVAPYAEDVLSTALRWGRAGDAEPSARVFGRAHRLPPTSAAFVNAFQIHCQEFDCVHEPAVVHPMASVFAALAAEVDAQGGAVSGRELTAATVVAVDVAAALGVAARAPIRFFRPANAGVFGAALGVARLRGFAPEQAHDALGYALAQCAGTMQAHVEGKPALPIQIAGAARAALVACDLAEQGVPGPHDVFEGPFGYLQLFEGDWDLAPALDGLGAVWRIEEVSHKPFPTGRAAQGGVTAFQELRANGVAADAVEAVTLTAPPLIKRLVGRPFKADMGVNYARLCFPYIGACVLIDGDIGLRDFSAERLADPAAAALAACIEVVDDGGRDPAAFAPQIATARLKTGAVVEARVDALYGSPAEPMDKAAYERKFRRCLEFAGCTDAVADRVLDVADRLDAAPDARALIDALEQT
ncbi:MAG: MmgE/PrpD family protein [Pseudomonadota bacterium]